MKILFLFIVVLASGASGFSQDLGKPTSSTPYDPYIGTVRSVMSSLGKNTPPLDSVSEWVRIGRGFRYYMKNPLIPQTPAETEATRAGDCKAKSLWLADKMDDRSVRFVIGKAKGVSGMNHAWLIWQSPEGWLVLDPTLFSRPLTVSRLGANEFIPLYSYTANGKFVHPAALAKAAPSSKYGDH